MNLHSWKRVAVACAVACIGFGFVGAAPAFDSRPWLEDLDQAQAALSAKYANLEWAFGAREADLPALFAQTRARVKAAQDDGEARAAFERLTRKLGDGHVGFRWPVRSSGGAPEPVNVCAQLGYNAAMRAAPLLDKAEGYRALPSAGAGEFPSGLIKVGSDDVAVVKIGIFMPQGTPALCEAALKALAIAADKPCDEACSQKIDSFANAQMTRDLAEQLRIAKAAGATALVVDITDNGGGSEWSEAAARMLTPLRLTSARMGFVRGEHWTKYFTSFEADMRGYLRTAKGKDRVLLTRLLNETVAKKRAAMTPCDGAPLWKGEALSCSWLGEGFYGSGMLASADPAALKGKPWAGQVFTPMQYPFEEGVWRGKLIVLVNREVWSAAEQFAAVLQDNHAAVILGEPTGGAGCGHTDGGTPELLKNSGATLVMPDCVRFRADGSNEVSGIAPDVLVAFRPGDGPRLRAEAVAAKLPEALKR